MFFWKKKKINKITVEGNGNFILQDIRGNVTIIQAEDISNIEDIVNELVKKGYDNLSSIIDNKLAEFIAFNFWPRQVANYSINIKEPESHFIGRINELLLVNEFVNSKEVSVISLLGWGGQGKSAIVRQWFDDYNKSENKVFEGVFWYGFYDNSSLERLLDNILSYLSRGFIETRIINNNWAKIDKIKLLLYKRKVIFVFDGYEEMQVTNEGEFFGNSLYSEIKDLIVFFAENTTNNKLIITSRIHISELKKWNKSTCKIIDIEQLEIFECLSLMQTIGVRGTEAELRIIAEEYKGHALSLSLLSHYLVEDYEGDISMTKKIPPFFSDVEVGGKAHRVLKWYYNKLNNNQRVFLFVFSSFRTIVTKHDFDYVIFPHLFGLNSKNFSLSEFKFNRIVTDLCKRKLISKKEDNTYTTHPLIKNFFYHKCDSQQKLKIHRKIYKEFKKNDIRSEPNLDEMQPIFEELYHGCKAGLHEEVLDLVYYPKIFKNTEGIDRYYLLFNLGAWGTHLSIVRHFFVDDNINNPCYLREEKKVTDLMAEIGLSELSIGKINKAITIWEGLTPYFIKNQRFTDASISFQNLAGSYLKIGDLENTEKSAFGALKYANIAKDSLKNVIFAKEHLAYCSFLRGDINMADELYEEIKKLEIQRNKKKKTTRFSGEVIGIYGIGGVQYSDFLLATNRTVEALKFAEFNLNICKSDNFIDYVALCYKGLANVQSVIGDFEEARNSFMEAISISNKLGMRVLKVEIILDYCKFLIKNKNIKNIEIYFEEAESIILDTECLFYLPMLHYLKQKIYPDVQMINSRNENIYFMNKEIVRMLDF